MWLLLAWRPLFVTSFGQEHCEPIIDLASLIGTVLNDAKGKAMDLFLSPDFLLGLVIAVLVFTAWVALAVGGKNISSHR
jgi:hypothetical protein